MTHPTGPDDIARRAAAQLVDIDTDLPTAVDPMSPGGCFPLVSRFGATFAPIRQVRA